MAGRSGSEPVANVEQAGAWDGDEGAHWVEHEERYNLAVARYDAGLAEAAGFHPGNRVLDVGCGCGKSTRDAARAVGTGIALGVDLSARMLERARLRSREEGVDNARFERADAQVHPFPAGSFDVVISRFGAMFFGDPAAAFANLARAMAPGGRLAVLAWKTLDDNEWLMAIRGALAAGRTLPAPPPGAPGPFGLAVPDQVRALLAGAGFAGVAVDDVREPISLGRDTEDAFRFLSSGAVVRGLLGDLDAETAAGALAELRALLAAHDTGDEVLLGSSAWLITAHRA